MKAIRFSEFIFIAGIIAFIFARNGIKADVTIGEAFELFVLIPLGALLITAALITRSVQMYKNKNYRSKLDIGILVTESLIGGLPALAGLFIIIDMIDILF